MSELAGILLFLLVFSGNGTLLGIELFFIFFFVAMILVLIYGNTNIGKKNLIIFLSMFALLIISFPISIQVDYSDSYILWPVKALLLLIYVSFAKKVSFGKYFLFFLGLFLLFILPFVEFSDSGRMSAIFGPNILYRIFAFSFCYSVLAFYDKSITANFFSKSLCLIIFLGSSLGIAYAGSVGGIVTIIILIMFFSPRKSGYFSSVFVLTLWYFSEFIFRLFDINILLIQRLLSKSESITESARFVGWSDLISLSKFPYITPYETFTSVWSYGFYYPHNIFLELFLFFGLFGALLAVFLIRALLACLKRKDSNDNFIKLLFLVIFTGSLFSGELSDNYAVVSLAGLILMSTPYVNYLKLRKR